MRFSGCPSEAGASCVVASVSVRIFLCFWNAFLWVCELYVVIFVLLLSACFAPIGLRVMLTSGGCLSGVPVLFSLALLGISSLCLCLSVSLLACMSVSLAVPVRDPVAFC